MCGGVALDRLRSSALIHRAALQPLELPAGITPLGFDAGRPHQSCERRFACAQAAPGLVQGRAFTKIMIRYFESQRSWARLRNSATRTSLIIDPTLPFELQPGGVWSGRAPMDRGTTGALYLDLYHSHSTKPVRTRVLDKSTLPPGLHSKRLLGRIYLSRANN
jgi:hypothetical protein